MNLTTIKLLNTIKCFTKIENCNKTDDYSLQGSA